MFTWLPETYDEAPPAVSALLAAVQFNVALVGVFRVLQICGASDQHRIHAELLVLGLATMAISALGVMATHSYKKLIAYASLNHGGVIAIGLALGKSAAYGVVLYVVSNAIIKAVLFLTAGKIRSHYRSGEVEQVSGLIKEMPYTGLFFAIGTFALLGLPPSGSFLGELLILSGLIREGYLGVFAMFGGILTITFVATGRRIFPMIWGPPPSHSAPEHPPFLSMVPKLLLVGFLLAMGLYLPPPINTLFRQVAGSLGGE
jgi:hydrogenase-4 component F